MSLPKVKVKTLIPHTYFFAEDIQIEGKKKERRKEKEKSGLLFLNFPCIAVLDILSNPAN